MGRWNTIWDTAENLAAVPARVVGNTTAMAGRFIEDESLMGIPFDSAGRALVRSGEAVRDYPHTATGAVVGTYLANKFLGNPIGGTVDAVTFGVTNFRPDETRGETFGDGQSVSYSVPYKTGTPYDMPNGHAKFNYPVPPLNEKQIEGRKKWLMQQNALNSMTLYELDQLRNQGKQGYYV